jgi:hypothetical protein
MTCELLKNYGRLDKVYEEPTIFNDTISNKKLSLER